MSPYRADAVRRARFAEFLAQMRDANVERAIEVILTHARSGEIGDGKVFVLPVVEAVRIRTGERGEGVVAAHDEAATTA